ncbi:MAG: hypothetical protein GC201_02780 [Alphaproteobacteria bacterium]|nr:hypothetical protein [Alphaproteobacteria bacterium]
MRKRLFGVGLLLAVSLALPLFADPARAATVERFTPEGTVKDVRQVTVRFSAPMVALGDPRLADPVDVACSADGRGRWADSRNWVYDFAKDLPGGVTCTFTVKDGVKALDGSAVSGKRRFSFDTGGPAIRASLPRSGDEEIDENQAFVLALDAKVDPATVRQNAYCAVEGVGERVPVEVLDGKERQAVLQASRRLGYAYYSILWKNGAESMARVRDRSVEQAEDRVSVLRCRRGLPPATRVDLVWGKGIATPGGLATSAEQKLSYRVRPPFTARVGCERANPRAGCLPMRPIQVSFSAPVPREKALAVTIAAPDGTVFRPGKEEGAGPLDQVEFAGPFPERASLVVRLPEGLTDDAGRSLENADRFPLKIGVDEYPPLAKFSGEFGIIEWKEGGVLPVTLRNVEPLLPGKASVTPALSGNALRIMQDDKQIAEWLRRVQTGMERRGDWVKDEKMPDRQRWIERTGDTSVFGGDAKPTAFKLPKPLGRKAFEVVGIPLQNPGFYVVELASPILGAALMAEGKVRYVATTALVTDMTVHFKWGRERSLVWVTRLHDAKPVADAQIAVTDFCTGQLLWSGKTGRKGTAAVEAGKLPPPGYTSDRCNQWSPHPLMVSARTSDDMSFTLSSWNNGIAPYDFNLMSYGDAGRVMVHTVFDRPLFRAGETVSMKHYLRRHTSKGIDIPVEGARKADVRIVHDGSGQTYDLTATFDAHGIAEQRWQIPEGARLGEYRVVVSFGENESYDAGSFRVEEFRVPTMTAVVQGPKGPLVRPDTVTFDLYVAYLSGGGASGAPVKLRTVVRQRQVSFPDYDAFTFGGKPVKEGLQPEEGTPFDVDPESREAASNPPAQVIPAKLDEQGAKRLAVPAPKDLEDPSVMVAELEYSDANGEVQTVVGRVNLWPSALNVGIKRDGWAGSSDSLRFSVVVLDLEGKPVSGGNVRVALYQRQTYSYRKRLIGGFYDYESTTRVSRLPASCDGTTDGHGLLHCDVAPGISGEVLIRAEAVDPKGRPAGATTSAWVAGAEDTWFDQSATDRMDVLPEQLEYEAGDTARFQVRMPFRTATALVTIEREGVIDSFVTELSGSDPVVEVPLKDNYAPDVFVSVLAVRGRVSDWRSWLADMARQYDLPKWLAPRDGGKATARVDLSKPAYRLGMAKIRVGWKPYRLDVAVKPEGDVFKVRDRVKVRVHVDRANGKDLPAGGEVAIAAVDEGLLELAPNNSWKLLDAMMDERSLEVWTATAQMQVVGKRHYGRKGVPVGGGGGRSGARELFDTLLLWKGRVALDKDGNAEVLIPLNDSLSSFRIVAVASAGEGLFGTGSATIATTQDLMIHSGLPQLVREGDRYRATFTLRNTTGSAMKVEAAAKVSPALAEPPEPVAVDIPAGGAREVNWTVTAPVGAARLAWDVEARQQGAAAADRLKVTQKVEPAIPVRTYMATLDQLAGTLTFPAERPADAIPGRGGLSVSLRSTLGGGLDGVRDYMSRYPYTCFEQLVSRAVALRDEALWRHMMAQVPAYEDADGLLRYFQSDSLQGDDTLTTYVLAIANEAGWEIPDAERETLLRALADFVSGRITRYSAMPTADLSVRKIAAIEALSRYGAATPDMLTSIAIEPNLWPTSAVIDWRNILKRVDSIPDRARRLAEADSILHARLNFQGTTMGFSTERRDALWWLMISTDSNANRLLLSVMDDKDWRGDIPRMVRGTLGRQQKGHWNTTVANAWGLLAMEKFSAAFESTPVTGTTALSYGDQSDIVAWEPDEPEHQRDFAWQDGRQDLVLKQEGTGRPWAMVRAMAAIPLTEPLTSGFTATRTVTPVEQAHAGEWTRGDVARVTLELDAQSDMTWVVVADPVPAGASILGSLGGQSEILTQGEQETGYAWKAYEERRAAEYRAYYRFVPKGKWTVEYTVRFNNPGTFQLPATRIEAMYAPEMFGEYPNPPLEVKAP